MWWFSCCVTPLPPPSRTLECCRGGRVRKSAARHRLTSHGPALSERQSNTRAGILAIFVSTQTPACRWFYRIILQEKWNPKAFHLPLSDQHGICSQWWNAHVWISDCLLKAGPGAHGQFRQQPRLQAENTHGHLCRVFLPAPPHLPGIVSSDSQGQGPPQRATGVQREQEPGIDSTPLRTYANVRCSTLFSHISSPCLCPQMSFYLVNLNCLVGCLPFPNFWNIRK